MLSLRKLLVFAVSILLALGLSFAQGSKKSYVFKGTVTEVDVSTSELEVANENIPGWMAAMTMNYKVDDPAVLNQLRKGDRIEATVYDGDVRLYKIKVVGHDKK